jgi:hypothetical protein
MRRPRTHALQLRHRGRVRPHDGARPPLRHDDSEAARLDIVQLYRELRPPVGRQRRADRSDGAWQVDPARAAVGRDGLCGHGAVLPRFCCLTIRVDRFSAMVRVSCRLATSIRPRPITQRDQQTSRVRRRRHGGQELHRCPDTCMRPGHAPGLSCFCAQQAVSLCALDAPADPQCLEEILSNAKREEATCV